jgi:hypothetical protein
MGEMEVDKNFGLLGDSETGSLLDSDVVGSMVDKLEKKVGCLSWDDRFLIRTEGMGQEGPQGLYMVVRARLWPLRPIFSIQDKFNFCSRLCSFLKSVMERLRPYPSVFMKYILAVLGIGINFRER